LLVIVLHWPLYRPLLIISLYGSLSGPPVIFLNRALARGLLRGTLALLRVLLPGLRRLLLSCLLEPLVGPIFRYIFTGVTVLVLAGSVSAK